jgi:hypothetical protein
MYLSGRRTVGGLAAGEKKSIGGKGEILAAASGAIALQGAASTPGRRPPEIRRQFQETVFWKRKASGFT